MYEVIALACDADFESIFKSEYKNDQSLRDQLTVEDIKKAAESAAKK